MTSSFFVFRYLGFTLRALVIGNRLLPTSSSGHFGKVPEAVSHPGRSKSIKTQEATQSKEATSIFCFSAELLMISFWTCVSLSLIVFE